MAPFTWTDRRTEAAQLVAEDHLSDEKIGEQVGISREALRKWKRHPDFIARVAEIVEQTHQRLLAQGIRARANRVAALDRRHQLMERVIAARAVDTAMKDIPGGTTGLLVHTQKQIGGGPSAQVVDEYQVDVGLLRELRGTEEQAAREMGEWAEKSTLDVNVLVDQLATAEGLTDAERAEARILALAALGRARGSR